MPLLRGKPFIPKETPTDLSPDEEVFICSQTNEVFRNYEEFFDRQYLCNTYVWSCQLTGQHNLTYQQAVQSEREAKVTMSLLSEPHKEAILWYLHNTSHSNMRTVVDKVTAFFKDRFVVGEELEYQTIQGDKKSSKCVKVVSVSSSHKSPPSRASPNKTTPIKSSDVVCNSTTSWTHSPLDTSATVPSYSLVSASGPLLNHISTPGPSLVSTSGPMCISTPEPIVCTDNSRVAMYLTQTQPSSDYIYTLQDVKKTHSPFTSTCDHLSRSKSVLTKEKIKLFLKNTLHRGANKQALLVKPEYVEKYQLGPSQVVSCSPSIGSRSLSHSNLDSLIISPTNNSKKQQMILSFFSPIGERKIKSPQKKPTTKTPVRSKSRTSVSGGSARKNKTLSPKSQVNTPNDSSASIGAKKVLKKAKQMKQLDLRKSFIKSDGKRLSQEIKKDTKRVSSVERLRLAKLEKKKELREKKRLEKKRELELKKPIEDTQCVDSKPLPFFEPVTTTISPELFADAVEVLEFLHHYGPLFNIKEAIHTTVTFQKLEEALVSSHPHTILYEVIKFLLQSIFATMEEEHEATVAASLDKKKPENVENNETESGENDENHSSCQIGSRRSSVGSIPVEELEEERPLDVKVASLKVSAAVHALWPQLTQGTPLFKLAFDPYTCSEILRLHLLSCGGYKENSDRNSFRYCNRGGYTDSDDPVLEFRLSHSDVIEALAVTSIYDLSPCYKLQIISILCLQLLGFASSREYMEEMKDKSKSLRRQIRELKASLSEKKKKKKSPEEGSTGNTANIEDQGPSPLPVQDNAETKQEKKERVQEEIQELTHQLYPLTACLHLQPLGFDRYHNRYWCFPSLPGLYIEKYSQQLEVPNTVVISSSTHNDYKQSPTSVLVPDECTKVLLESNDLTVPITTSTGLSTIDTNQSHNTSSSNYQQLHSCSPSPPISQTTVWCSLSSQDEINTLIDALNSRGIREVQLKESIQIMSTMLDKPPTATITTNQSAKESPISLETKNCDEYLELYLREQILDLEEKIWMGNLGYMKDVKSRTEWKNNIESSGAAGKYGHIKDEDRPLTNGHAASEGENMIDDMEDSREEVNSVQDLAKAVLQIQQGIEKKFLLSPLGTAVDMKGKAKDKKNGLVKTSLCLDEWKSSLSKATSYSQVFVHLSTLERAVAWSKSLMNVRCRICRRKGGDEYMLLCDGCDHGYHTYCLRPPVYDIPEEDWFCYNCCPVTPMKRRTVSTVSMKEESDSESADSEEEEEEEEESEEEEEMEIEVTKRKTRNTTMVQRQVSTRMNTRATAAAANTKGYTRKRGHQTNVSSNAKKRLKLDKCDVSGAEEIISSIIDVRCSKVQGPAQEKALKTLEFQLTKALLDELTSRTESKQFMTGVRRREYPDYYDIVSQPMDFKTISSKVSSHKYSTIDQFLSDVNLIFSNCSSYFKRKSKEANAGTALKRFFDQRYSDLGLRSLIVKNSKRRSGSVELRSFRH